MILIEKWKFKISRGNKMATYYEFKKIIGKIFGCGNIEENEDDSYSEQTLSQRRSKYT